MTTVPSLGDYLLVYFSSSTKKDQVMKGYFPVQITHIIHKPNDEMQVDPPQDLSGGKKQSKKRKRTDDIEAAASAAAEAAFPQLAPDTLKATVEILKDKDCDYVIVGRFIANSGGGTDWVGFIDQTTGVHKSHGARANNTNPAWFYFDSPEGKKQQRLILIDDTRFSKGHDAKFLSDLRWAILRIQNEVYGPKDIPIEARDIIESEDNRKMYFMHFGPTRNRVEPPAKAPRTSARDGESASSSTTRLIDEPAFSNKIDIGRARVILGRLRYQNEKREALIDNASLHIYKRTPTYLVSVQQEQRCTEDFWNAVYAGSAIDIGLAGDRNTGKTTYIKYLLLFGGLDGDAPVIMTLQEAIQVFKLGQLPVEHSGQGIGSITKIVTGFVWSLTPGLRLIISSLPTFTLRYKLYLQQSDPNAEMPKDLQQRREAAIRWLCASLGLPVPNQFPEEKEMSIDCQVQAIDKSFVKFMEQARQKMQLVNPSFEHIFALDYFEYRAPFAILERGKTSLFDVPGFGDSDIAINVASTTVMQQLCANGLMSPKSGREGVATGLFNNLYPLIVDKLGMRGFQSKLPLIFYINNVHQDESSSYPEFQRYVSGGMSISTVWQKLFGTLFSHDQIFAEMLSKISNLAKIVKQQDHGKVEVKQAKAQLLNIAYSLFSFLPKKSITTARFFRHAIREEFFPKPGEVWPDLVGDKRSFVFELLVQLAQGVTFYTPVITDATFVSNPKVQEVMNKGIQEMCTELFKSGLFEGTNFFDSALVSLDPSYQEDPITVFKQLTGQLREVESNRQLQVMLSRANKASRFVQQRTNRGARKNKIPLFFDGYTMILSQHIERFTQSLLCLDFQYSVESLLKQQLQEKIVGSLAAAQADTVNLQTVLHQNQITSTMVKDAMEPEFKYFALLLRFVALALSQLNQDEISHPKQDAPSAMKLLQLIISEFQRAPADHLLEMLVADDKYDSDGESEGESASQEQEMLDKEQSNESSPTITSHRGTSETAGNSADVGSSSRSENIVSEHVDMLQIVREIESAVLADVASRDLDSSDDTIQTNVSTSFEPETLAQRQFAEDALSISIDARKQVHMVFNRILDSRNIKNLDSLDITKLAEAKQKDLSRKLTEALACDVLDEREQQLENVAAMISDCVVDKFLCALFAVNSRSRARTMQRIVTERSKIIVEAAKAYVRSLFPAKEIQKDDVTEVKTLVKFAKGTAEQIRTIFRDSAPSQFKDRLGIGSLATQQHKKVPGFEDSPRFYSLSKDDAAGSSPSSAQQQQKQKKRPYVFGIPTKPIQEDSSAEDYKNMRVLWTEDSQQAENTVKLELVRRSATTGAEHVRITARPGCYDLFKDHLDRLNAPNTCSSNLPLIMVPSKGRSGANKDKPFVNIGFRDMAEEVPQAPKKRTKKQQQDWSDATKGRDSLLEDLSRVICVFVPEDEFASYMKSFGEAGNGLLPKLKENEKSSGKQLETIVFVQIPADREPGFAKQCIKMFVRGLRQQLASQCDTKLDYWWLDDDDIYNCRVWRDDIFRFQIASLAAAKKFAERALKTFQVENDDRLKILPVGTLEYGDKVVAEFKKVFPSLTSLIEEEDLVMPLSQSELIEAADVHKRILGSDGVTVLSIIDNISDQCISNLKKGQLDGPVKELLKRFGLSVLVSDFENLDDESKSHFRARSFMNDLAKCISKVRRSSDDENKRRLAIMAINNAKGDESHLSQEEETKHYRVSHGHYRMVLHYEPNVEDVHFISYQTFWATPEEAESLFLNDSDRNGDKGYGLNLFKLNKAPFVMFKYEIDCHVGHSGGRASTNKNRPLPAVAAAAAPAQVAVPSSQQDDMMDM